MSPIQQGFRTLLCVGVVISCTLALSCYRERALAVPSTQVAGIPKARPVAYEDLLGIVDLEVWSDKDALPLAIAPDGSAVAVELRTANLVRNREEIKWLIVPLRDKGAPTVIADEGEPISFVTYGMPMGFAPPQVPTWSPDSSWIYFRSKRNGSVQLWRVSRDGKNAEQLTHSSADVDFYKLSNDGQRITFLTKAAEAIEKETEAEGQRGYLYDARFAPSVAVKPLIPDYGDDGFRGLTWTFEVDSRTERLATDSERMEIAANRNSNSAANLEAKWIRTARAGRRQALLRNFEPKSAGALDPPLTVVTRLSDRGKEIACAELACTARFHGLWISEDGRNIFFLRYVEDSENGSMALYRWNIVTSKVSTVMRTDDLLQGCALSGGRLVCAQESVTTPARLVSIELPSGSTKVLYDPNPQFGTLRFGQVTPLHWRDKDGEPGFGHLVKPVNYDPALRYPLVIVQYHSHGFLRGGIGDEYPIHVLASKGFAVLSFDREIEPHLMATAKSGSELDAALWNNFADRRQVFSKLEAGIELLDEMGVIDAKRIGISGLSDGANTTAFSLIHAPTQFAAAAVSGTYWSPLTYYLGGPMLQSSFFRSVELGFPDQKESQERWQAISLGQNANSLNVPLLIQVSDSELLTETQNYTELRQLNRPVEMHVFPNEWHIKSQPAHRYNIYRRNVQWFEFWLQGIEEDDPVDPTQYARWRALRRTCNCSVGETTVKATQ